MASDISFVEYVCDQFQDAQHLSFRKMFGEYALYIGNKVVALVCDNQLFVKPTEAGRRFLGEPKEGLPYPGASPWFLVDEDLDDGERISALLRLTERELPEPKPKRKRKKKVRQVLRTSAS